MELKPYIPFAVLLIVVTLISTLEGSLYCFRKYKAKNGECAGHLKKFKSSKIGKCCKRGMGYAVALTKIRKNRYECVPCGAVITTTPPSTNEAPEWSEWSDCSVSCGAGWRSRYKVCSDCDRNDQENVKSEPCMTNYYCPIDGNWGPWFPWESCTSSCGGGVRQRDRRCNYPPPTHGGDICSGSATETDTCNLKSCPVNGQWGSWTPFSLCSVTCGHGVIRRSRECNNPRPQGNGAKCPGQKAQSRRCNTRDCAIHGGWSLWSHWSHCDVTCGEGQRVRTRDCNTPPPRFGGGDCEGDNTEEIECSVNKLCPVNGGWGSWTHWGHCRALPCDSGVKLKSRSCDNPRPRHHGRSCRGRYHEEMPCINMEDCPTEGKWCEWNSWSSCTATCAGLNSMQVRQRVCHCPTPIHGGPDCDGQSYQVRDCKHAPPCNPYRSFIGQDDSEEDECDPSVDDSGDGRSKCIKKIKKEVGVATVEKAIQSVEDKLDTAKSMQESTSTSAPEVWMSTEFPESFTDKTDGPVTSDG